VAVYGTRFLRPGKDAPVGLACPLDALRGRQPKAPKGLLTLALVDAMRQHKERLPALVEAFMAHDSCHRDALEEGHRALWLVPEPWEVIVLSRAECSSAPVTRACTPLVCGCPGCWSHARARHVFPRYMTPTYLADHLPVHEIYVHAMPTPQRWS